MEGKRDRKGAERGDRGRVEEIRSGKEGEDSDWSRREKDRMGGQKRREEERERERGGDREKGRQDIFKFRKATLVLNQQGYFDHHTMVANILHTHAHKHAHVYNFN